MAGQTSRCIHLMGRFRLYRDETAVELPANESRLVAFLALHPGQQRRSFVAGRLWPEITEQRARANLRNAVWKTNVAVCDLLDCGVDTIGLAPGIEVDVETIRQIADALLHRDAVPDPTSYAEILGQEMLLGWDDDWALFERERVKQLCVHALEKMSERCLETGAFASAIDAALFAVRLEPLRETAHRAVSRAHLVEGNPAQARRQYEIYSNLLASDLGIEPSPAYRELVSFTAQSLSA
jgi:DNA-binding SARP family transcriptional activator